MVRWDAGRVAALAPDQAALTAARELARPGPWTETGCSDVLVWGRCQGSGSTPYRASVDLTGPAYRCSCPSRKFPCKHALALLLLWADGVVTEGGIDETAAEWARGRAQKAAPAAPTAPPDGAGREKRLADRLALMDRGAEDAARWLGDLARGGLAAARTREYATWDEAARRLVDAQLPGLATRVRALPAALAREDWTDRALDEVGLLWSLLQVWRRRDALDADTAADLRAAVGWAQPKEEVRAADEQHGDWAVLGARRSEEGRLVEQRTWLRGADGAFLLLLDFAVGAPPVPHLVGSVLRGGLSRYPGAAPRRAVLHEDVVGAGAVERLDDPRSVGAALDAAAAHLADAPWAARTPVVLEAGFAPADGSAVVTDGEGALPLAADADPWLLAALTGGEPARMFGELEAGAFRPLSVLVDRRLVAL